MKSKKPQNDRNDQMNAGIKLKSNCHVPNPLQKGLTILVVENSVNACVLGIARESATLFAGIPGSLTLRSHATRTPSAAAYSVYGYIRTTCC